MTYQMRSIANYLPVLQWGRGYNRSVLFNDLLAAVIVTMMLIPQSLAYALLAGLPPEAGLYASIVPIVLYSVLGTSGSLAVGPVAVVSLMTAVAIGNVAESGTADYASAALTLAFLSGLILLGMGFLKLGFVANFLSHSVISGFITAAGVLIAVSQLKYLFGVDASGHNLLEMGASLVGHVADINAITFTLGVAGIVFLFWVRSGLKPALLNLGVNPRLADVITKTGPVLVVVGTTAAVWFFDLTSKGVSVVGSVPQSLPPLSLPNFSVDLVRELLAPALLISIIGFVESISVAQTLAAKKGQRIQPDQELLGLGAANIGAAFTGGYPVTGGFARSVVNFDAGAETPAAGAYTALMLAVSAITLTPLIYYLPHATLSATIIVAVLSLVDFKILGRAWDYSKADFAAIMITILMTLGAGVEAGVTAGVATSILLFLYKTSRPNVAEVGLVPDTQHFRNVQRNVVLTDPDVLSVRVDESLYFANAHFLEDYLYDRIVSSENLKHVVLMCSAVNEIDMSALESLEKINHRFRERKIQMHLSEVKGPVMDRLQGTGFLDALTGNVFQSQFDAIKNISPDVCKPRVVLVREEPVTRLSAKRVRY